MNCDCAVNIGDVPAFVQALVNPAGCAWAYPGCGIFRGDVQPDGDVNGGDAQAFVNLLVR